MPGSPSTRRGLLPTSPTGALGPWRGASTDLSDTEIRSALQYEWATTPELDDVVVVEEVRCWRGYVRADYLCIANDTLSIIEIKSDRDTLRRLQEQVRIYSAVADRVTLVVGWALAARALRAAPSWWDVVLAERRNSSVHFVPLRDGLPNPGVTAAALTWMLPVEELRHVARKAGLPGARLAGKELRQLVAEHLTPSDLRPVISRWLTDLPQRRVEQVF